MNYENSMNKGRFESKLCIIKNNSVLTKKKKKKSVEVK